MFNNIFLKMSIKKVIHCGLSQGEWGNRPNFFLSVITVFTWISKYITWISKYITWISKQYPHFYAFYGFLMCNYSFFYNTSHKNCTPEKWRFRWLQSLLLPQFSTCRHRTGFILKRKWVWIQKSIQQNYKFVIFLQIFKV